MSALDIVTWTVAFSSSTRAITPAGIIRFFPKIQNPVSTTRYAAPTWSLASSIFPMLPSVASTS